MFKAKWPAYLTCGEGPLLGSQLAIFSLCPHEQGLGALWGLSYKGTNPIPEGFSFTTNHLPKALSPNTITPGIRFKHKNLRWGETTIWFGWSINLCVRVLSHVWLFVTPWTVTCQAPLSIEFSRQEYWSGLPFPPPRDLPDRDWTCVSYFPALAGRFFTTNTTWEAQFQVCFYLLLLFLNWNISALQCCVFAI